MTEREKFVERLHNANRIIAQLATRGRCLLRGDHGPGCICATDRDGEVRLLWYPARKGLPLSVGIGGQLVRSGAMGHGLARGVTALAHYVRTGVPVRGLRYMAEGWGYGDEDAEHIIDLAVELGVAEEL